MRSSPVVDILRTIRGNLPRVPFEKIAREILPKNYSLSLVVCGDTLAQRMNRKYRKKNYYPNVLSFPLSKIEGEIFLNIRKAEREARRFSVPTQRRLAHLFAHGCCHLAGYAHGKEMEAVERKVLKKFGLNAVY